MGVGVDGCQWLQVYEVRKEGKYMDVNVYSCVVVVREGGWLWVVASG